MRDRAIDVCDRLARHHERGFEANRRHRTIPTRPHFLLAGPDHLHGRIEPSRSTPPRREIPRTAAAETAAEKTVVNMHVLRIHTGHLCERRDDPIRRLRAQIQVDTICTHCAVQLSGSMQACARYGT